MPFLWLKSSVASHISLENYNSLNRAYRVLLMVPLFHVLLMIWSYWHVLQVLSSSRLMYKHVPLPSAVTWLAHHHHSGLEISATASGRPSQLCTFLISCTFPLQHLLQTVVTIYVDSCDCSVSFLPTLLAPQRKG